MGAVEEGRVHAHGQAAVDALGGADELEPEAEVARVLEVVVDIVSSFYLHLEVADRPGVLAAVADVLGRHDVSVKSVLQKGLGENARLVMVMHPVLESRFFEALDRIAELDFMRAKPRAIRVIEEEFH